MQTDRSAHVVIQLTESDLINLSDMMIFIYFMAPWLIHSCALRCSCSGVVLTGVIPGTNIWITRNLQ